MLQVQVQDAFKAEAITVITRLKEEMAKQAIPFSAMDNTEPKTLAEAADIELSVKGVPLDKTAAFRTLVNETLGSWVMTPLN